MTVPTEQPAPRSCPAEELVLHADIDAFFASVEQLHHPRLRGRPVMVGYGVIASCSYEARRFGLHAGMSIRRARELCPHAVRVDGDRHVYEAYASKVFATLRSMTAEAQTYFDEAYCSLAGLALGPGGPGAFALRVRDAVRQRSGLSVTVGVGPSRLAAKLAGKTVKPGGARAVGRDQLYDLLTPLSVDVLPGVGPKTRRTLSDFNVTTVGELRRLERGTLTQVFGERGSKLFDLARADDDSLCAGPALPRTISRETSFHRETSNPAEIEGMLFYLCERAAREARSLGLETRTVTVKIRYADLRGDGIRTTLDGPTERDDVIADAAMALLRRLFTRRANLSLVGVVLSGFSRSLEWEQLDFFGDRLDTKRRSLYRALDRVRDLFGHSALVAGRSLHLLGQLRQDEHGFVLRTPSLTK